jgi:TfoX/Sxy family transcriptional regulator of competence genes
MTNIDPKVMAAFELMIGGVEDVVRKGISFPYVTVRGNMYAMVSKTQAIGVLVDESNWRTFELAGGVPFEAVQGIPLKGFGTIPETMYRDRLQLQSWFRRAREAAERLPEKDVPQLTR